MDQIQRFVNPKKLWYQYKNFSVPCIFILLRCMLTYTIFCHFYVILRIYKFIGFIRQGFYLGEGFMGYLLQRWCLLQIFCPEQSRGHHFESGYWFEHLWYNVGVQSVLILKPPGFNLTTIFSYSSHMVIQCTWLYDVKGYITPRMLIFKTDFGPNR